jgi:hypothetical protein
LKMIDAVMGWKYRSTSATNSDAGVKLGVPTSSRTARPTRIEIAVPLGLEVPALLGTRHPRSDRQDLGEHLYWSLPVGSTFSFLWLRSSLRCCYSAACSGARLNSLIAPTVGSVPARSPATLPRGNARSSAGSPLLLCPARHPRSRSLWRCNVGNSERK